MKDEKGLMGCMKMMAMAIGQDDLEAFKNYFEQFHEIAMEELSVKEW